MQRAFPGAKGYWDMCPVCCRNVWKPSLGGWMRDPRKSLFWWGTAHTSGSWQAWSLASKMGSCTHSTFESPPIVCDLLCRVHTHFATDHACQPWVTVTDCSVWFPVRVQTRRPEGHVAYSVGLRACTLLNRTAIARSRVPWETAMPTRMCIYLYQTATHFVIFFALTLYQNQLHQQRLFQSSVDMK